jgi:exopolysaccharide production protein ExoY
MYISGTKDVEFANVAKDMGETRANRARKPAPTACRVLDIMIASAVLMFVAPLMLVVAIAIKIQDGGPVFFGHGRIGYEGRSFRCWKFRSMVVDAEARLSALLASDPEARREWDADQKLRRDPRVTLLGRFLRVSSVDELPQLFNVLTGEMSLVGPRPIVTAEVARYGSRFASYCSVRPGITGLWQVSGRNDVGYRSRVAMDTVFAKRCSASLYVQVLLATVPAVLCRKGSY